MMLYVTKNKQFGRAIGKEIFFDSYTVLIQLSLVFDQQFAFEYFYNCSDHKAITKITRSMFGLTGMSVVKLEMAEIAPLLGPCFGKRISRCPTYGYIHDLHIARQNDCGCRMPGSRL